MAGCCSSSFHKQLWRVILPRWSSIFQSIKKIPYAGKAFELSCMILTNFLQGFYGLFVARGVANCNRPDKTLILYEYEGCPYCQYVRRTLSALELDYISYPCPRETLRKSGVCVNSRFRPELAAKGVPLQFPYLEDPNTGKGMSDSIVIANYLWSTYGDKAEKPLMARLLETSIYRSLLFPFLVFLRPGLDMGVLRIPSKKPEKLLHVWGMEPAPFVRFVREKLSCLEIPHFMHVVPFGAKKRPAFKIKHQKELEGIRNRLGMIKVPYIEDPNTGVCMFESSDIVAYLEKTYQVGGLPNETWADMGVDESKKSE